jgi:tetratricopeptide (TPR) repeat protein
MPTTLLRILSLLAMLSAATSGARADEAADDLARTHFEAAQAHFETGAYEDAIGEFSEAHRLSGRPALLYNIYLCHERLGDLDAAVENLARFLEADPDTANAAALKARLANLRRRAASARAGQDPEPPQTPALVPETQPAVDEGAEVEAAPAKSKAPAIAALTLGGAGLVGFGAFALLARQQDVQLDGTCRSACTDADVKNLRAYSLAADVSLGVGVAGLVVGGALWWVRGRRSAAPAVQVAPVVGQRDLGLWAEGRF